MKKRKIQEFFSLEENEKFNSNILGDNREPQNKMNTIPKKISKFLDKNEKLIQNIFSNCFDLAIKDISLVYLDERTAFLAYLTEFSSEKTIDDVIISKLNPNSNLNIKFNNIEKTIKYAIGINKYDIVYDFQKCVENILDGKIVIFVDMLEKAFIVDLKKFPTRTLQEPSAESVLRGPRQGFTEDIITNISLIRKLLKNKNLKIERLIVGKETPTTIGVCYIKNLADKKILQEIKHRISKIPLDAILDSNYIVEAIEDDKLTIVPTIFRSERPDTIISKLIEGKFALIIDGSPVVITVPALFVEFMQSPDDYYTNNIVATLNRCFRYLGLFITLTLPAMYVSLLDFHQELLPTSLVISIIKNRSGVPFPALIECFLMLSAYDIIREAGLRIPKSLGQTISIVGALVLGDASVKAGIIGAPIVMIVAFAGISFFTIPSPELNTTITILKYVFLLLSSIFGIFGLINGILFLFIYMTSRRSFGTPYMYPIAPFCLKRNLDVIAKLPNWMLTTKSKLFKK